MLQSKCARRSRNFKRKRCRQQEKKGAINAPMILSAKTQWFLEGSNKYRPAKFINIMATAKRRWLRHIIVCRQGLIPNGDDVMR